MGPHVFACGNFDRLKRIDEDVQLQWGRTFLRAEIGASILKLLLFIWASMGPHVFACGNRESSDGFHAGGRASMGPHVFACGNPWHTWMRPSPRSLQWGRTFLRAEMAPLIEGCGAAQQRFNGAARFCVRKSQLTTPSRSTSTGFNGAARFCVRKSYDMSDGGGAYRQLQWGRTFLRAEISLRAAHLENDAMASMGPHVFACGNGESTCLIESEEACFNGAARFCVRKYGSAHPGFFTVVVLQWGRTFLRAEISR